MEFRAGLLQCLTSSSSSSSHCRRRRRGLPGFPASLLVLAPVEKVVKPLATSSTTPCYKQAGEVVVFLFFSFSPPPEPSSPAAKRRRRRAPTAQINHAIDSAIPSRSFLAQKRNLQLPKSAARDRFPRNSPERRRDRPRRRQLPSVGHSLHFFVLQFRLGVLVMVGLSVFTAEVPAHRNAARRAAASASPAGNLLRSNSASSELPNEPR